MTTPTEMPEMTSLEQIYARTAGELYMLSIDLRLILKRIRHVDFKTETHMQEAIENLQQTLCAIWEEFEDDELTMTWRRQTKSL